ncbi:MAG: phosphoribosylglycinamide formyltransferase [Planctomycetia bacterium]|nr:phosphoribosylglycinamide formyltransferase [Planctomycetia bacterium]
MTDLSKKTLRVAVLISGGGTTLRNILAQVETAALPVEVVAVISSAPRARGLEYARAAGIATAVIERREFATDEDFGAAVFNECRRSGCDYVVMAGYLKFVPIPDDFALRVLNIHPGLIPAFCGHGMYGHHVHEAVLAYGAKLSGCTVHFVDNQFDHGPIILQRAVPVLDDDTPDTLAARVFEAECIAYPEALRLLAAGKVRPEGRRIRIS